MFADFDGDGILGYGDLQQTLLLLTNNELNDDEIDSVIEKVFVLCPSIKF